MKLNRVIKRVVIAIVVLLILVAWFMLRFPSDPLVYCQKALYSAFEQWVMVNKTNVLPNVNGNGKDSLTLIGEYMPRSYAEGVPRDYGYVPGLNWDDPNDLVMMYPTRHSRNQKGFRLCGLLIY
jgi:hypothetical protein